LGDYSKAIQDAGLELLAIKEPRASVEIYKTYPELKYFRDNPVYIMFEICKGGKNEN